MSTSKNKRKKTTTKKRKIICKNCGEKKIETEYYTSSLERDERTGRLPYCKDCITKMCYDEDEKFSKEKFTKMLRLIDKPYIQEVYKKCLKEDVKNPIGKYIRMINLGQYKKKTWMDGEITLLEEESRVTPTLPIRGRRF